MKILLHTKGCISSGTYYNFFKGKFPALDGEYPLLEMAADVSFSDERDELDLTIINSMWKDPLDLKKEGFTSDNRIDMSVTLTIEQVEYLYKFLKSFLKNNKRRS